MQQIAEALERILKEEGKKQHDAYQEFSKHYDAKKAQCNSQTRETRN